MKIIISPKKYLKHRMSFMLVILLGWQISVSAQPRMEVTSTNKVAGHALPAENSENKLLNEMLAAGLGGFLAWLLTASVGFYLTRQRLLSYLLVTINSQLSQYNDLCEWLEAVKKDTIKKDHIIRLAAQYTKGDLGDFTEMREQCLTYLRKNELVQFTKFLQRIFEMEALFDGFCKTLEDYKLKATVLSEYDVEYLTKKYHRIRSYIKILPKHISNLNALPLDYSDVLGAQTIVTTASSFKPHGNPVEPSKIS